VGCLVSKVTPGLVVSTVVMVVTARKVRLVLKVSLVQRVPRVYKVWLAHAENVVTMVMMVSRVPQDLKVWLVMTVPQVLVENVVFQVQTGQKERPGVKALLVSVGCRVSKATPGLVVSTVVMVVTARKVRLVLKVSLVRRVRQVLKVLLANEEKMVTMVMMELKERPGVKALLVIVGCLVSKVMPGLVVSTVVMVVTA